MSFRCTPKWLYVYWRRQWQPTPVFLPVASHGPKSLAGHSTWSYKSWTRQSEVQLIYNAVSVSDVQRSSALMLSHEVASTSLWPPGPQRARLLCPPLPPRVFPKSCPWSQWCYLTISSTAATFSFCLQSFPASGSFPKSRLYTHTYIILFIFFSIICYYKILSLVPHVIHIFFFFFFSWFFSIIVYYKILNIVPCAVK